MKISRGQAALILLTAQLLLVLSIAGKYWYERKTCPRLWVRSGQYDPNTPLRGRYLALTLLVDACNLPRNEQSRHESRIDTQTISLFWQWDVSLHAVNGKLVPQAEDHPASPADLDRVTLWSNRPCDRAPLGKQVDFFIPDRAKPPLPLKPGQELWVEVTLPPSGPPRPIQLALSDPSGFHPLRLQ